jgi:hypothetical protein
VPGYTQVFLCAEDLGIGEFGGLCPGSPSHKLAEWSQEASPLWQDTSQMSRKAGLYSRLFRNLLLLHKQSSHGTSQVLTTQGVFGLHSKDGRSHLSALLRPEVSKTKVSTSGGHRSGQMPGTGLPQRKEWPWEVALVAMVGATHAGERQGSSLQTLHPHSGTA